MKDNQNIIGKIILAIAIIIGAIIISNAISEAAFDIERAIRLY